MGTPLGRTRPAMTALTSAGVMYLLSGVPTLGLELVSLLASGRSGHSSQSPFELWTTSPWLAGTVAYASVLIATAGVTRDTLASTFARAGAATAAYFITASIVQIWPDLSYLPEAAPLSVLLGLANGTLFIALGVPFAVRLLGIRRRDASSAR